MAKDLATVHESVLKNDFRQAIIWQEIDDGVPEPALEVRNWNDGHIVQIKQAAGEILLNVETIPALIRVLRKLEGAVKK